MRLGFAIAAHLDADVLLLDEVFAVGDEAFQRKCFGKIFEFKQRGGTIVFVSHDAPRSSGSASARCCCATGSVEFDGPTHEAIVRYRSARSPRTRPGRARRRPARVGERRGADRGRRGCRAPTARSGRSSSPASRSSLRLRIAAERAVAPPQLSARAARRGRPARRRRRARHRRARLGRRRRRRSSASTSTQLPLADGRFHLRLGARGRGRRAPATTGSTTRSRFLVYPAGERARRSSGSKGAGRRRRSRAAELSRR